MRRGLRWGLVLAGLAVVVAVGAFVLWPKPDLITTENYERIRVGMNSAQVEVLLGPPGNHTTVDWDRDFDHEQPLDLGEESDSLNRNSGRYELWNGNLAHIRMQYDAAGNVIYATCILHKPIDHGPIGNLLWRAKRQWHRWFP